MGGIALAMALSACESAPPTDPRRVTVEMFDNRFSDQVIQVPVGGSVTFVGVGRNPHNAVDVGGQFSTESVFGGPNMLKGDEATLNFDHPGRFTIFCTFHGTKTGKGMVAELVVGNPAASAASQGVAETAAPKTWTGSTLEVPADFPTIQSAVTAAKPGDLVLIAAGTYREMVEVETPGLIIRGEDRNRVVIDASGQEHAIEVYADGVAVENLTVRDAMVNGVYWTGVRGYRASYVTAIDNGDYGIYAFDSSDGLFEHSYASGSPDSGFYIGQCDPCQAVISDVVSEWNGLGYSGTNASGDLYIINSVWRNNAAGIVPNTLDTELLPPFHDVTIAGNLIHDNDNRAAPARDAQWSGLGNGIILAGGNNSLVEKNRVVNHAVSGISITPNLDRKFWTSSGNVIRDNLVEGSGRADLALAGPAGEGNCFEGNVFSMSLPVGLEWFQPCTGNRFPVLFELGGSTEQLGRIAENGLDLRPVNPVGSAPQPGPQPAMPADSPIAPAVDVFTGFALKLEAIEVPALPSSVTVDQVKRITVFGVLLGSAFSVFFGLYAYFLPFVLYASWVAIALWDLARSNRRKRSVIIWTAVVLLVPFVGVVLFYLFGKSSVPAWKRTLFLLGGIGAYLIVLAVGALVGGIV